MNVSQRPLAVEPGDYWQAVVRRWWVVAGLLVLGCLASVAYLKLAPKVYLASASVYVAATGATSNQAQGARGGAVNMDNEAQVVQSVAVSTAAARMLHTSVPPATLSKQIKVTVPANSQILQIGCQQPTPESAAACAQAFAEAYLENRTATAAGQIKATLATLRSQTTTLQGDVAALTSKIPALPPNSSARAADQAQLKTDESQVRSLSDQMSVLTTELANSTGGQIISKAALPTRPNSPRASLVVPSGLAAGLLLGLIAAFAADRRDERVREARDLERRLDLPVLLTIAPGLRSLDAVLAAPRSRLGRAFAEVAQETISALGDGHHVVLVASASAGAGGSLTAANLAAAFARSHPQVVLVCADQETSVAPSLFGLGGKRGLADVLAGAVTLGEAMQRPADLPRLQVLPPGTDTYSLSTFHPQAGVHPDPGGARLAGATEEKHSLANGFRRDAAQLFSDLRRSTPLVVIEMPAAREDRDTFELAEFADAALVVVEAGKTRWPEAGNCVRHLGRLRTMVLGAVLIPPAVGPARARKGQIKVPHVARTSEAQA